MDGEPSAFTTTQPIDTEVLNRVLQSAHVELLPGGPTVTYARDCLFRGHTVPHLAVLTPHGPVVVMVLTWNHVSARRHFSEHNYEGELVPMAHGSLAVVSKHPEDFDAIASAVVQRIRYLD